MAESKIRLMLADDHVVVRSGLRMLLDVRPDIEIVGEAENGREAVEKAKTLRPDVILMDIQMPDMTGIEATERLKEVAPDTAVLATPDFSILWLLLRILSHFKEIPELK